MKFFISYGRDLSLFVKHVSDELISMGHEVWLDTSEINSGDDWRECITSGILESDVVLAFLSSYGLRKGGVCLDELAIAVSCSRKTIKTFVMQPGLEDIIPSTVRRIQYYDLSSYAKHVNESITDYEASFYAWFDSVRNDLLDYIVSVNDSDYEWIDVLEARLKPSVMKGREIAGLRQMFVSREWMDNLIEKWMESGGEDKIILLTGYPGFGKSIYCMNFYHYNPYVVSLSLCDWSDSSNEGISGLIRSTAFNLAVHLPSYGKKLLWLTDEYADKLLTMDPQRLFNILIVEPLITEIDGGHHPVIIILDGLDRLTVDGDNKLADIIAGCIGPLPDFVNIIISTRKDSAISRLFSSALKVELGPESKLVAGDIERYLRNRLSRYIKEEVICDEDINILIKKCSGSFLLAKFLTDGIIKGSIRRQELDQLPSQLSDIFFQWMHRIVPDETEYEEKYYSPFAILAAAGKGVSHEVLRKALNWRKKELKRFTRKFSVILFENMDDSDRTSISFFNQSFGRWISDENGNADAYLVDIEEGMDLLCEGYFRMFREESIPDEELYDAISYFINARKKSPLRQLCSDEAFVSQILTKAKRDMNTRSRYIDGASLLRIFRKACEYCNISDSAIATILKSEIPYLIASGSFYYSDLLTTKTELEQSIVDIREHMGVEAYMNSLYYLGTAQDWLGMRDKSIESFLQLSEVAASITEKDDLELGADDHLIRALTGLIWNDHFTNAKEGQTRLKELGDLTAGSKETELSKFLIEARLNLTLGRLEEALNMYQRTAEMAGESIWGYDSISVKNQMMMLEILVACFDNERFIEGVELGEELYKNLEGHHNIAECYCASWIAANSLKAGLYDKADKYLDIAEDISGCDYKPKSAWISMHVKSLRAFLDDELGKVQDSLEGHLAVIDMAKATNDDWVLGDACFEYIRISIMSKIGGGPYDADMIESLITLLDSTAEQSRLPHLLFKSRVVKMVTSEETLNHEMIKEIISENYSSTDMISLLYLLYRCEEGIEPELREALTAEVKRVFTLNNCLGFAQRPIIKAITKEVCFELYD